MEQLLQEMEDYAVQQHIPIINVRGREMFLHVVRECRPHHVLEIGTAIGYSTLLIAMNAAANVHITTFELDEARAQIAESYLQRSAYAQCIDIRIGNAGEELCKLAGSFDFVFIDAAKGQYVDYFHKILPLLSNNAVVLADNVLFRGYVLGDGKPPRRYRTIVKRLREYIELVGHMPGFVTDIYENGDGLAVSRRIEHDKQA
jgi:predicted O-methyltransferase YrrM